jgi:hypothetical protein
VWQGGRRFPFGFWRDGAVSPRELRAPDAFKRMGRMTDPGKARGAEATDADRASWAAETGAPQPATSTPSWQRYLRFWWIPALVVALAVGYLTTAKRDSGGEITGSGTLQIQDVRVGDCFDVGEADEVSEVNAGPCTDPHGYEMFHLATWTARIRTPVTTPCSTSSSIPACRSSRPTSG